jgi:23S rRNA pseudouridine1911/1915/1917 synthase
MPDNPGRLPCNGVPGDAAPNDPEDPEDMHDMDAPDDLGAPVSLTVPAAAAGRRLDRVLGLVFPGLGLRRLRRVFAEYEVTVDAVARQAAFKVRAGATLRVALRAGVRQAGRVLAVPPGLYVLAEGQDYAAVAKPGGLASAAIGPGGQESVEDHLPGLFPGREAHLLGRLDTPTSGILAVAFGREAARRFREAEDRGEVRKTYLAVVRGLVDAPFTARQELLTAHRATTRVRARDSDDPLRRTAVTPLGHDPGTDLTLVRADIAKGARHQIRAHLAARGHPILGDARYGEEMEKDRDVRLYLHHARIIFPGFAAQCMPQWSGLEGGSVLVLGPGVEQALDDVVLANEVGS